MLRFSKTDIERLSTLTHDEIRAAYARSGEYMEHFEIRDLQFVDFYVSETCSCATRAHDDEPEIELVAHYKATLKTVGEVTDDAHLYIAFSARGYLGSF